MDYVDPVSRSVTLFAHISEDLFVVELDFLH